MVLLQNHFGNIFLKIIKFEKIVKDDVTVYKGNNLLEASTDANSAVGLGNKNLFQSFIICSEHSVDEDDNGLKTVSTKLTYGKIAAGSMFIDKSFDSGSWVNISKNVAL